LLFIKNLIKYFYPMLEDIRIRIWRIDGFLNNRLKN